MSKIVKLLEIKKIIEGENDYEINLEREDIIDEQLIYEELRLIKKEPFLCYFFYENNFCLKSIKNQHKNFKDRFPLLNLRRKIFLIKK